MDKIQKALFDVAKMTAKKKGYRVDNDFLAIVSTKTSIHYFFIIQESPDSPFAEKYIIDKEELNKAIKTKLFGGLDKLAEENAKKTKDNYYLLPSIYFEEAKNRIIPVLVKKDEERKDRVLVEIGLSYYLGFDYMVNIDNSLLTTPIMKSMLTYWASMKNVRIEDIKLVEYAIKNLELITPIIVADSLKDEENIKELIKFKKYKSISESRKDLLESIFKIKKEGKDTFITTGKYCNNGDSVIISDGILGIIAACYEMRYVNILPVRDGSGTCIINVDDSEEQKQESFKKIFELYCKYMYAGGITNISEFPKENIFFRYDAKKKAFAMFEMKRE